MLQHLNSIGETAGAGISERLAVVEGGDYGGRPAAVAAGQQWKELAIVARDGNGGRPTEVKGAGNGGRPAVVKELVMVVMVKKEIMVADHLKL